MVTPHVCRLARSHWGIAALLLGSGCITYRYSVIDNGDRPAADAEGGLALFALASVAVVSASLGAGLLWGVFRWRQSRRHVALAEPTAQPNVP
jgi:hypothetical protein